MKIPFNEDQQLCHKLQSEQGQVHRKHTERDRQATKHKTYLPGDPRIQITDPEIKELLQEEFITRDLDKMAPHLWLMSTQSSKNISSLTEQLVRGRRLTISENPGLHLVWVYDRVFLKPLPKYLLSYAFWDHYLISENSPIGVTDQDDLLKAIRGFVRSYAYLIQHKSDFTLATRDETRLIPKNVSYADFMAFINKFKINDDTLVSPRYRFGELRLTRLNIWCKVLLFKFAYQKVEWQYGAHFARYYAPLLFIFAVLSLLTSAMQVVLATEGILTPGDSWLAFAKASRGFSVFTILFVACAISVLLAVLVFMMAKECLFAIGDLFRLKGQYVRKDEEKYVGSTSEI